MLIDTIKESDGSFAAVVIPGGYIQLDFSALCKVLCLVLMQFLLSTKIFVHKRIRITFHDLFFYLVITLIVEEMRKH